MRDPTGTEPAVERSIRSQRAQLWALWFALLTGPLAFAGIALYLIRTRADGAMLGEEPAASLVATVLGATSLLSIGAALVLPVLIGPGHAPAWSLAAADRPEARRRDLQNAIGAMLLRFRTRSLLGWALAEAGALLAGVGLLLCGLELLLLAPLFAYLIVMCVQAPTSSRLIGFVEQRLADAGVLADEIHPYVAEL